MYAQDGAAHGSNSGGDNGGRSGGRTESRGEGRGEGRGRTHNNERDDAYRTRTPRDYSRPAPAARDPFFDKPYEPKPATETAAATWEASERPAARGISANIKHKVKVAALFKAS